MAYGIYFGNGSSGKILLSIFRFFLIFLISSFLYKNIKKGSSHYLTIPTSFILSGAIGNFLDSALYGLLFDTGTVYSKLYNKWIPYFGISKINSFFENSFHVGYASLMEGCVVDMFYLPIINTCLPTWIPFFGGSHFQFFKPIFNLSDMFIFIGVILLFVFNYKIKNIKIL